VFLRRSILILFTCLLFQLVYSQQPEIDVRFLADSVKVGIPVPFSIKVGYHPDQELLMPDSTHDFTPFEWVQTIAFPSELRDSSIVDSTIYLLRTFEIDSIQRLSVPVYLVAKSDSLTFYSNEASVHFSSSLVDSLQSNILTKSEFFELKKQVNTRLILYISLGVVVLLLVVVLLSGKHILAAISRTKLLNRHQRFNRTFGTYLQSPQLTNSAEYQEKVLLYWKSTMEKLDQLPIAKSSTPEIVAFYPTATSLKEALLTIDKSIYGGIRSDETIQQAFVTLFNMAHERFIYHLRLLT